MPLFKSNITTLGLRTEKRSGMFGDPATPLTAVAVWDELGGGPTAAGEIVTERTAMSISTVYACVTILAEAVASLPCRLMRSQDGLQVSEATDVYMHDLLAYAPNPDMTAVTFWACMVGCSALTGNGYAEITRDADDSPNGFWPINPLKTEPVRLKDGSLGFRTTDGTNVGAPRIIPAKNMLHFPLFAMDGVNGIGPIRAARETFALTKAAEKYGARWFGNGAHADAILIYKDEKPDPKVQAELKESWHHAYGGANQGKQPFLFGNWDVKSIGLSPEDSQFIVSRGFQRTEIAAMFHLQPYQVGDTTRLSNANYTTAQLSFVTDTLRPILIRIEQELRRKLLPKKSNLVVEFDVSSRLRGDFATTMTAVATGRQWACLTKNEARKILGLSPVDGGDTFLTPVNMLTSPNMPGTYKDVSDAGVDLV